MQTGELSDLLLALRRKVTSSFKDSPLRKDLSLTQFEILLFLSSMPEATMDAVAVHLGVKAPSVTTQIAGLEQKKLVTRVHSTEDRRVVKVVLTPFAKKQLAIARKKKDTLYSSLFSKLSEADRNELARIITRLLES